MTKFSLFGLQESIPWEISAAALFAEDIFFSIFSPRHGCENYILNNRKIFFVE